MTINTTTSQIAYVGDGSTTAFPVPFAFFNSTDLQVIRRDTATGVETTLAISTDYTVSGGNGSTGTVTAVVAPVSSVTWTIRRGTAATQLVDLPPNGPFPADTVERALDRLTAIEQETQRDVGRALLVPRTEGGFTLPSSTARANKVLAFDTAGAPVAVVPNPPIITPGTLTIDARTYVTMGLATDQSAGLQAAINAAAAGATVSVGGIAQVDIPGGYLRISNRVNVPSFVSVRGRGPQATYIDLFGPGGFDVGTVAPAAQTRGQVLSEFHISALNATSGYAIDIQNAYNVLIDRVSIEQFNLGLRNGNRTNNVRVIGCQIIQGRGTNPIGMHWQGGALSADRTDVFSVMDTVIASQWAAGSTNFLWEGFAHTLQMVNVTLLKGNRNFHARKGAGTGSGTPAFLNAFNLVCEGAMLRGFEWESGVGDVDIVSGVFSNLSGVSGQGGADDVAFAVRADAGDTICRGFRISNAYIGLSRLEGMVLEGRDGALSNVMCVSCSQAGSGTAAAVRMSSTAIDWSINNLRVEEFGGAALASHALRLDAGAQFVIGNNINCRFAVTRENQNNSGNATNTFTNVVRRDNVVSNAPALTVLDSITGTVEARAQNNSTAGSAVARLVLATGVTNAFALFEMQNNSGSPRLQIATGAGTTGGIDIANRFGSTWLAVQTSYANDAAAAAGGVPLYGVYRNGSVMQIRVT